MKIKNWILVLPILLCCAGFYGYRAMDALQTDREPPEIEILTEMPEFSVTDDKSALTQGLKATDDWDGDVTASIVVEHIHILNKDGTISVDYAAFDAAGNVAKITREAKYTDYVSPRFQLNEPLVYVHGISFDVLSTVGAVDTVDGDIQHRVRATMLDDSSISNIGIHQVQFQVTNSLGDTSTLILPVEVYDAQLYEGKLQLTDYLIYLPKGASFSPGSYLDSFTLLGENTSLKNGLPTDFSLKTKGTVVSDQPGVYPVEFRVTYTDRHETNPDLDREYTGYSKMIVIVEG